MWKTSNYKGESVTWYSEEEYNKLLTALERIKSYLKTAEHSNNGDKFQLGHSKAETTTNIYMRNNQDMINHAMDKLNGIFEKNQQNVSKIFLSNLWSFYE